MFKVRRTHDRPMFWRIVFPALATFVFFVLVIFLVVLPFVESRLMDQKRLQIKELVNTVHADLAHHAAPKTVALLGLKGAQQHAIEHVRSLRYGPEEKDYFWINDMQPHMLMHPYRADLEGQDISGFADPAGKHLFVEAVQLVVESGAGYIEYRWQWKDDSTRVVPKISYVRGFEPWGWVIGSGIYIEDVRAELASTRRILAGLCGAILLVIAVLCAYLAWEKGMSPAVAERIFEPYFTTKPVGEGTGLGLAVVHGIVKKLGGTVSLESEEGLGTTFTVLLPLVDKVVLEREERTPPVCGSEHIMLVDDQSQVLEMLKRLLERIGYTVTARTSGADALKEFEADPKRIDLVVTDMTMPNMTGDALAAELLKRRPDTPVILCTGYSETMNKKACERIGIREIVLKPVRVQQLSEAIRRALDNRVEPSADDPSGGS
jgi:CheY-like chemotaxis protein